MACRHSVVVGDNYGTTCGICGEQLSGYGHWATGGGTCMHTWVAYYVIDDEGNSVVSSEYEQCLYCERVERSDQ